jgi:hypothetical protein
MLADNRRYFIFHFLDGNLQGRDRVINQKLQRKPRRTALALSREYCRENSSQPQYQSGRLPGFLHKFGYRGERNNARRLLSARVIAQYLRRWQNKSGRRPIVGKFIIARETIRRNR